jgi:RimJ/RimL family protein N-acetyltransferase
MKSASNQASFSPQAFTVLTGEKTILDWFRLDDITEQYIGWLTDPVVVRFSNQKFMNHTKDSCKAYLSSFQGTDNLFLKIMDKESQKAIGTMTAYYSSHHQTVDVGILIGDRSVWGQGFGLDAWCVFTDWLGEHPLVRKITAGTMRPNLGMARIMEQSGMVLEAVRPGQELLDGQPQDLLYYGKFTSKCK